MTTSKLRRPNFNLSLGRQSNDNDLNLASASASASAHFRSVGSGNPIGSVSSTTSTTSSTQSLANYTRQCHKRLASSILPTHGNNEVDARVSEREHHKSNTTATPTSASLPTTSEGRTGGVGTNNTNISSKTNNDTTPNLEQCILLLEPILNIFQTNCIMNDKAKRKQQHSHRNGGIGRIDNDSTATVKSGVHDENCEDDEGEDEDEIPPQLLRAAKFFPYRFIPMKRALLRPPPSPPTASSCTSTNKNDHSKNETNRHAAFVESAEVELSLHYRLRLVRACWKRGLVAAAEYETLQKSIERTTTSKKRKRCNNEKNNESDEVDGIDTNNLMERVRLSFLRLPTEAIHPHRSMSAWNHVKEMISQCCELWEKDREDQGMTEPACDDGRPKNDVKSSIAPDQVADWAMTSWTALLLVRGLDCGVAPPRAPSTNTRNHHHDTSLSSIERHLSTLLTNRSTSSDTNNSATDLARSVECRLNILLHPENIQSLNGTHIYSLGRLLASFHNRDDAIVHIARSVCHCAIGRGGMMGLEQLARLLAVYLCCISSSTSPTSMDANHGANASSIVRDVEAILRAKLGDVEFLKSIVKEMDSSEWVGQHSPSSVKKKAASFLEAVLSTTAHLVKCCE
ncbi:hypothetical protein ACHAWU_010280 [Discostella pseudostelligera]|uniref:Uncharacterized protein n=1 Tax=Discostella pseudostelligera TaxID=259834 RepID=A0ABD3MCQ1_9STRA